MDKAVLKAKLEALARCGARIKSRTPPTADDLKGDYDSQDIISVNLERAVQICVDIAIHIASDFPKESPKTMADAFLILARKNIIAQNLAERMLKAIAFRNISVHQYQSVNWEIAFSIAKKQFQ